MISDSLEGSRRGISKTGEEPSDEGADALQHVQTERYEGRQTPQ